MKTNNKELAEFLNSIKVSAPVKTEAQANSDKVQSVLDKTLNKFEPQFDENMRLIVPK